MGFKNNINASRKTLQRKINQFLRNARRRHPVNLTERVSLDQSLLGGSFHQEDSGMDNTQATEIPQQISSSSYLPTPRNLINAFNAAANTLISFTPFGSKPKNNDITVDSPKNTPKISTGRCLRKRNHLINYNYDDYGAFN